ncbi:MAG: PilN domain-containing protein [Alphaproteobacteria bacterium]|nr:PilN domain-containing protein [Alphaproteobacteria bacterium]
MAKWARAFAHEPFAELCSRRRDVVVAEEDGWQLFRAQNVAGGAPLSGTGVAMPELGAQLREILLCPPPHQVFQFNVMAPAAAQGHVDEFVELEMARLTPFQTDDILWAWHVSKEGPEGRGTWLSVYVVLREAFEQWRALASGDGMEIAGLIIRDGANRVVPVVLGPLAGGYGAAQWRRWQRISLVGLAFVAASAVFLWLSVADFQQRHDQQLQQETAQVQVAAKKVRDGLQQAAFAQSQLAEFEVARAGSARRMLLLEALGHILPSNTFLTTLSIDGASVTLDGLSALPESLIPALESSGLAKDVGFAAPVVSGPGEVQSHFIVKFTLKDPSS